MAVYSDAYLNAYKTSAKTKLVGVFETPPARTLTAEMKVFTGEFTNDTLAAIAIGMETFVGRLPKNVTIRSAFCVQTDVAGDPVVGNADVGLYNLDETAVATGDEILSAAANKISENSDLFLAADKSIAAKMSVAIAVGSTLRVVVMYTEM
jgi:hypothetical protein